MNKKYIVPFLMVFSVLNASLSMADSAGAQCPAKFNPFIEAVLAQDPIALEIEIDKVFGLLNVPANLLNNPLDAKDASGNTAVHYACKLQNKQMLDLLLKNGASVSKIDAAGKLALDVALETKNLTMIDAVGKATTKILSEQASLTSWCWSCAKGWAFFTGISYAFVILLGAIGK